MGTYHEKFWRSEHWGGTRQQRKSGAYSCYVPDFLCDMGISLDADVIGDLERAQRGIADLNGNVSYLHDTEGLARLLLRAEAVSSSYIEGLTIGTRKLLRSELNVTDRYFSYNETATTVLGNIRAMQRAVADSVAQDRITVDTIVQIHHELMKGTPLEQYGGVVREEQNWVGGSSSNPLSASYIPPGPEHVPGLLEDLAEFANRDDVPTMLRAALVHAQFESIHPFVDGNGRTGRALIHTLLRRDEPEGFVPPVSLVMATHVKDYTEALNGFRFDSRDEGAARAGVNDWVSFFAGSVADACAEARSFESDIEDLVRSWRDRLSSVRGNSALDRMLDEMVGAPLFTISSMSEAIGRSIPATTNAVNALVSAGIIREVSNRTRNRVFEATDVIDQFNLFERRLASPIGDTKRAKPARPVPDNLARSRERDRRPSTPAEDISEAKRQAAALAGHRDNRQPNPRRR